MILLSAKDVTLVFVRSHRVVGSHLQDSIVVNVLLHNELSFAFPPLIVANPTSVPPVRKKIVNHIQLAT